MNDHTNNHNFVKNLSVAGAQNVLSRLFRMIGKEIGMTEIGWSNLMDRYLNDSRNGIPRNGKDRSSARGNLNKELNRPKMTWKVFLKGLRFLAPKWVRLEVHMGWHHHPATVHVQMLDISMDIDNEEDDDIHSEIQELHDRLIATTHTDHLPSPDDHPRQRSPYSDAEIATVEEQHAKLWNDQVKLFEEFSLIPLDRNSSPVLTPETTK